MKSQLSSERFILFVYTYSQFNITVLMPNFVCLCAYQAKRDDCVQKKRNVPQDIADEKDENLQVHSVLIMKQILFSHTVENAS